MSNNCVTSGMNVERPDTAKHTENSNEKDTTLFQDWNTTYQSTPERNQYENELPETVLRSDNGSNMRCISQSSPAARATSLTTTKRQPTTQPQNHSSESKVIGMGGTPPPLPLRPPAVPKRTRINGVITNNQQAPSSTTPILKIQIPTTSTQTIPTVTQQMNQRIPPTPLSPRKLSHQQQQQQKGRNNNNTLTMVPPVIKSRQCTTSSGVNQAVQSIQPTTKTILPSLLNSSTLSTQTILFGNNTTDSGGGIKNTNNYLDNLATIQQLQDATSAPSNMVTTTGPSSAITTPPTTGTQIPKSTSNSKISIRQDSNVSSDSFSQTSSPSYTTKTMETPLIPPNNHHSQSKSSGTGHQSSEHNKLNKLYNVTSTLHNKSNQIMGKQPKSHHAHAIQTGGGVMGGGIGISGANNILKLDPNNCGNNQKAQDGSDMNGNGSSITKSVSTPASLQTIVRFHNGSNMSLHHRIIRDMRRPSGPYGSTVRVKFRFAQVLINAIALLAISGGLAAYFRAYPSSIQVITTNVSKHQNSEEQTGTNSGVSSHNPAPGICLPVIVNFCLNHKVPYNFTVFPNYMGHFSQRDAQQELEVYDAVVDVRCYELAALFLCSVFVPKCGTNGQVVRPCRSLCFETKRRCGFFLDVFGLSLPEYLECGLFPESTDPEVCVGHKEVKEAKLRAQKPVCTSGFKCDIKRCIPGNWQCDGHIDCKDQSDELNCKQCAKGMIHCGDQHCMAQEHMCDGVIDCPWGQDELNCLRLSDANGDEGHGQLEVFLPEQQQWVPACVTRWDPIHSANEVCSLLGYTSSNWTGNGQNTNTDFDISPPTRERESSTRKIFKSKTSLVKEFRSCAGNMHQSVNLTCTGFACGKIRKNYKHKATKRIVGGNESAPGDWPFLAALLGGPEEVFYCAGVLIADQWILTASHCVGNHSDVSGWTIQLGITRRHSHTYYAQKMKVRRVVPHPMYNLDVAHDNDVALFQLASKVTFHEHLLPVCLPPPNRELVPGTMCTVIGWGKREDKGMSEYEPAVNEVEVPVINRDLCNEWLEHRDLNVTDGMICAGYADGGKDACQGDSGGPLLCKDDNDPDKWFVGGIVSWGIKCAHPHLPGVYAYVPRYIPWITQQIAYYSNSSIN